MEIFIPSMSVSQMGGPNDGRTDGRTAPFVLYVVCCRNGYDTIGASEQASQQASKGVLGYGIFGFEEMGACVRSHGVHAGWLAGWLWSGWQWFWMDGDVV